MEAFKECLVKRECTPGDRLGELLLLVFAVVCTAIGILFTGLAFIMAVLFLIAWYVHVYLKNLEFEYTLVQNSLRVATIYNKKTRKDSGEYSLKDVLAAADQNDDRLPLLRKHTTRVLDFSAQSLSGRTISLFIMADGKKTEVRLSPDETMYKLMWKQISTFAKHTDSF